MADDDKKGSDDPKTKLTDDPAFQELKKAVQGLSVMANQQAQSTVKMQENFNTFMEEFKAASIKKSEKDDHLEADDINDLDNVGLMKMVTMEVGKLLDKKLEEVSETVNKTQSDLRASKVTNEVKEIMKEHPDFLDWKDELAEVAKENPGLSLRRMYSLVRLEDPDKAADLDKKYAKDDGADKSREGFMGLMPTVGGYFEDDPDKKPMTTKEAAEKAWEETVEEFPALAVIAGEAH